MKKKYSLTFVLTSLFIAMSLTALVMCAIAYVAVQSIKGDVQEAENYGFDEILGIIDDKYIGSYDPDELIVEAKRAVIDALDDNWSYYMTPDEFAQYLISSENTYHGIGVEVLMDDEAGGIKVTNVYSNSGAQAAGIVPGDTITAIDGASIRGLSLVDVRSALRRELGDTALLTVLRSSGDYEDVTVVYNVIFTDPVSFEMFDGNIGYIKLRNFDGESGKGFVDAVDTLVAEGAEALIFDVRSNFGGRVNEMAMMLDYLLPEGVIFISVDEYGREETIKSDAAFIDLPAVVLVNSNSYSGAEYFTATLSEYGYAVTVGEPTTGKNRMQATFRTSDGGAVHISTGMFLTPNHIDLFEQGGYTPDYVVPLSDEELIAFYSGEMSFDNDPQLQRAIELITN